MEFLKFKEFEYTLIANNETLKGSAFIIALANSSQYGNNFNIASNAKSNDGLINALVFRKPSMFAAPKMIWKIFKGKPVSSKFCTEIITPELIVKHQNQLVHLDGEVANFEIDKLSIKVIQNSLLLIS